jgi:hypothetical protein
MRVFLITCDKYLWALRPFEKLFNKYWGSDQQVVIAGFSPPSFQMSDNFSFVSMGNFADYPVEKWSNALIKFLKGVDDELFIWMMEDYWLTRCVNREAIESLGRYMLRRPDVVRGDITADRLYAGNMHDVESFECLDIVKSTPPAEYHLSFQAGIWRRKLLLKYLATGETPWQTELSGTTRMIDGSAVVVGTRQFPVRYIIGIQSGEVAVGRSTPIPNPPMRSEDSEMILSIAREEGKITW